MDVGCLGQGRGGGKDARFTGEGLGFRVLVVLVVGCEIRFPRCQARATD